MIVFKLPPAAAEQVAFCYSPLLEAVLSLHVLVEPKHHPVQHEWVRSMRRLSPWLRREIEVFAFAFRAYFPEFLFPAPSGEMAGFEGELRRLRSLPDDLVRMEFAIPLAGRPVGGAIPRDPSRSGDLAHNPVSLVRRMQAGVSIRPARVATTRALSSPGGAKCQK